MTKPLSHSIVAASKWYAILASGTACACELAAWQAWKEASIENQQAWQQLEEINQQFKQIPPNVGLKTLQKTTLNRRQALKQLAVIVGVGSASWIAYREQPWRPMLADYKTPVGATQEIQLDDGTQLTLNTETSINVQYTSQLRQIELIQGEVLIKTGHRNTSGRDFTVKTPHGLVTALGTHFLVRNYGDYSKASLFEGVVRVVPDANQKQSIMLKTGESVTFSNQQLSSVGTAKRTDIAWANGVLVAYAMPLKQFAAELSRYRPGILRCDPAIELLEISGTFSTKNPDTALETLASTLPVRIHKMTDYWVTIQAL